MNVGANLSSIMRQFVPAEYWEFFCAENNLDTHQYPFLRSDYDIATGRNQPYAVFAFARINVNGLPTAGVRVTYKCLFSRSVFDVDAYPSG